MCSYILEEKHRNDPKFVDKNLVSHLKPGETTIYTFWRGSSQWGKPGTKSPVDQSPPDQNVWYPNSRCLTVCSQSD